MLESPSTLSEKNIETIIQVEEEDERRHSRSQRILQAVGGFVGTGTFVGLQLLAVACWLIVNTDLFGIIGPFDPYPFSLLSGILSLEAVLLTSFVLIRQNQMDMRADRRNHLGLQINLLAEKESTKILQILDRLSRHFQLQQIEDPETAELRKETTVGDLARQVRRNEEQQPKAE
jgi:uncharacterized membrane protein